MLFKLVEKYFLGLIDSRSLPKCDLNCLHKIKLYQRSQLPQKELTVISFPFASIPSSCVIVFHHLENLTFRLLPDLAILGY